jgi:hypothetical protein
LNNDAEAKLFLESGRTSGHLANAFDDGYTNLAKKYGQDGAKLAAESHAWPLDRVGEISKALASITICLSTRSQSGLAVTLSMTKM